MLLLVCIHNEHWTESSSIAEQPHGLTFNETGTFIVHIIQSKSMVYKPSDHLTLIHCFFSLTRLFNLLLYFMSCVYDVMPFHLNYSKLFSVFVCLFVCYMSNYFEFVMRFLPRFHSLNVLKFMLYLRNAHCTHTPTYTHNQRISSRQPRKKHFQMLEMTSFYVNKRWKRKKHSWLLVISLEIARDKLVKRSI